MITEVVNENTHPALLLTLFFRLPILGFPISIFLVLLGIRFGSTYGVVFMIAGMPIHLPATIIPRLKPVAPSWVA
jgi:hypothetical protein